MALTCNAAHQNDGWRTQADRLTSTHGVFGVAAITLAGKARRRPVSPPTTNRAGAAAATAEHGPPISQRAPTTELATELDRARATVAGLERQLERKTKLAKKMQDCLDAWHERATLAEAKIADLQSELDDARAAVSFQQNENCSLQASLDLLLNENSRQSQCLVENEAVANLAQRELTSQKTRLAAVETERNQLLAAARATSELHQAELDNWKGRLAATASGAIAAEQLLERLRHSMVQKLKLIQNASGANDRRVQELEHSLAQLIDGAVTLLTTVKARDLALASANEKIIFLAEQVARLEVDANGPKVQTAFGDKAQPDDESTRRSKSHPETGADDLVLHHPVLGESNGHLGGGDAISDASGPSLTAGLLAETITF